MGEIADYMIDQMIERSDITFRSYSQPSTVECKRCGKGGLHWEDDNGKWRLVNAKGLLHVCDTSSAADDFEVLK